MDCIIDPYTGTSSLSGMSAGRREERYIAYTKHGVL